MEGDIIKAQIRLLLNLLTLYSLKRTDIKILTFLNLGYKFKFDNILFAMYGLTYYPILNVYP